MRFEIPLQDMSVVVPAKFSPRADKVFIHELVGEDGASGPLSESNLARDGVMQRKWMTKINRSRVQFPGTDSVESTGRRT